MTYDAVLVARRGLGADELRLVAPGFLDAVRWSVWAERLAPGIGDLETVVATEPTGLAGKALMEHIARRSDARKRLARLRRDLMLDDGDG